MKTERITTFTKSLWEKMAKTYKAKKDDKEKMNKFVLGQYFTKERIVRKVITVLSEYKEYDTNIRILEPSFGTGNFIRILKDKGFDGIEGCEIDSRFTTTPTDFFEYPLNKKFDLVIGNPPFTKYNIKESYYYPENYLNKGIKPEEYLTKALTKKKKIQIENAFTLKSIQHLKDKNSSIGFVLPISFFIKNKNKEIKKELLKHFSTIIIYQNEEKWFDEPIPCCFAIFTNIEELKDKILLLYENDKEVKEEVDKSELLTKELIPKSFLYKKNNNLKGMPLSKFLIDKRVSYSRSYKENNVSGATIVERRNIPNGKDIEDYNLAVVRVGNSSVGRTGLININEDILNDMFYVFGFKKEFNRDKQLKEKICNLINENQEHFKNLTIRVGSKSIKKDEILAFKVPI